MLNSHFIQKPSKIYKPVKFEQQIITQKVKLEIIQPFLKDMAKPTKGGYHPISGSADASNCSNK